MIKLTKELFDQCVTRKSDTAYALDFHLKQLITFNNLQDFVKLNQVVDLMANQNNIKSMESCLSNLVNLKTFDLSLNYIKEIENFNNLIMLESLNLSTNKLMRVPDLSSLKSLKKLFADMQLPNLDTLKLSGNQMMEVPYVFGCPRLRELDFARNQITSITRIVSDGGMQFLEKLKGSFNRIQAEYLEEFCFVLSNLPNLMETDFKGNDICLIQDYQLKILKAKKLKVLDNHVLTEAVIQNMINLNKNKQYEVLIQDTKEEYFRWMDEREKVRKDIRKTLLQQTHKVDELFDDKREESLKELMEFMKFVKDQESQKKSTTGHDVRTLQEWRIKIMESEQVRVQSLQILTNQQARNRDDIMNNQISSKNMVQKLYDIALNEPDIWREIKRQEIGYMKAEQQGQEANEDREVSQIMKQDQPEQFNQVASQVRRGILSGLNKTPGSESSIAKSTTKRFGITSRSKEPQESLDQSSISKAPDVQPKTTTKRFGNSSRSKEPQQNLDQSSILKAQDVSQNQSFNDKSSLSISKIDKVALSPSKFENNPLSVSKVDASQSQSQNPISNNVSASRFMSKKK